MKSDNQIKSLAEKLITFKTESSMPNELSRCIQFVKGLLVRAGLRVRIYKKNGKTSLLAAKKIKTFYEFILSGHLDVVPADYKNAYNPTIKNGRLYGRGASDMKGAVAAMLTIMQKLLQDNRNVDVALLLTTDEEIGGFNGTKYLLEEENISCKCAIVPDGGINYQLTLAEKGVLHVKVKAYGKAMHGSRPWLGVNAVEKIFEFYASLKKKIPRVGKVNNWKTTVNLGKIQGGKSTNTVPGYAEMHLDFRFPKKIDGNKIIELLDDLVKKYPGTTWETLLTASPMLNDRKNPYFKRAEKALKMNRQKYLVQKQHGASDGRFFSEKGIPVIMFLPKASNAHIDNEWVDVESLKKFTKIVTVFLSDK